MSSETLTGPDPTQTSDQELAHPDLDLEQPAGEIDQPTVEMEGQLDIPFYDHPEHGAVVPSASVVIRGIQRKGKEILDKVREKRGTESEESDQEAVRERVKSRMSLGLNLDTPQPSSPKERAKLHETEGLLSQRSRIRAELRKLGLDLGSTDPSLLNSKLNRGKQKRQTKLGLRLRRIDSKLSDLNSRADDETRLSDQPEPTQRAERFEQPELPMEKEREVPEDTTIYKRGELFPRKTTGDNGPRVFESNLPEKERRELEKERVDNFNAGVAAAREAARRIRGRGPNGERAKLIDPFDQLTDEDKPKILKIFEDVQNAISDRTTDFKNKNTDYPKDKLLPWTVFEPILNKIHADFIDKPIAEGELEGWTREEVIAEIDKKTKYDKAVRAREQAKAKRERASA